jgi:hypothetical protein
MAPKKEKQKTAYKLCAHGHKNSPNAKECWVCRESLIQEPKEQPKFIQKTDITVTNNVNLVDVNKVPNYECEKYVGKRERCDEKDPSGLLCAFRPNCMIRLKRFKNKPALDIVEGPK